MVRNVREDVFIWDSCVFLNNTYSSLNTKLSLIWSHNYLRSIQIQLWGKADLLVKRMFVWPFSHRKALWPFLHLVWSSLKSESPALLVFWLSLCAVWVSKPDSSGRKQTAGSTLVTQKCSPSLRIPSNGWSLGWLWTPCVMGQVVQRETKSVLKRILWHGHTVNGVAADTAFLTQFSPMAQVLHGIVWAILLIAASVVS